MTRSRRTKRQRRYSGCAGKVRFGSWDEARAENSGMTAYLCGDCGCWHLTANKVSRL